jgi:N6-adenosine-specific RNA methylase IME4
MSFEPDPKSTDASPVLRPPSVPASGEAVASPEAPSGPFDYFRGQRFGAILADPPWRYEVWSGDTAVKRRNGLGTNVSAAVHYDTMSMQQLAALPVKDLAAENCVLFCWVTWPTLLQALDIIKLWGFSYKTCAFDWTKANAGQIDMFSDELTGQMGMGYWTRANTEPCLLATRGRPKRLNADVRQSIISPRREHSRKPNGVHQRIERLVGGPYIELFARQQRQGWSVWGNETSKFKSPAKDE